MATTKADLFLYEQDLAEIDWNILKLERTTASLSLSRYHTIFFDNLETVRGLILALRYLEADYANTLNAPKDTDEQD